MRSIRTPATAVAHPLCPRVLHWLAAILVVACAGCSREPVSTPLPSDIDPLELRQRLQKPGHATGNAGAELSVVPGYVGDCSGWELSTATVRWKVDATQLDAPKLQLQVSSRTEPVRKPFAGGLAVGEATAGKWVREGVAFHLVDLITGRDLASYTVEALPCARM